MNNEFIVLRAKRLRSGEYSILCSLPENPSTPWATWIAETIDGKGRYHGQYYYPDQEATAYEDFETSW